LLYKTHVLGGFATGYLVSGDLWFALVAACFSLLPDIECTQSFLGRRFRITSHIASRIFGHRQALHSLVGAVAVCSIIFLAGRYLLPYFFYAALAGYLSHLFLDTLNPEGIPWLWPIKFKFRIPITEVGGTMERAFLFPSLALVVVCLVGRDFFPELLHFLKGVFFVTL